tara:strand:+ start:33 stop:737 length:705 start_codon:yes stop_codon:yes gene_type:complete
MDIDASYDFRNDVRPNNDPDIHSEKLKLYHKILWSKPLPSGEDFLLDYSITGKYLSSKSSVGEFELSSDSITHSYIGVKRMNSITKLVSDVDRDKILKTFYTIGGFIIFPSNKIDNKQTINGSRGFNSRIVDRFDLTLECIRRFYLGIESPLYETFSRYKDFFQLFDDFQGYAEFFLLQDIVTDDFSKVKFFLPFDDSFPSQPLPKDLNDYLIYIKNTSNFVVNRGNRMTLRNK